MFILPHKFESITENQWRAGRKRRLCAGCHRDYSDSVHLPPRCRTLTTSREDYYVPESAVLIAGALHGLDDGSLRVSISLVAYTAEAEMVRN